MQQNEEDVRLTKSCPTKPYLPGLNVDNLTSTTAEEVQKKQDTREAKLKEWSRYMDEVRERYEVERRNKEIITKRYTGQTRELRFEQRQQYKEFQEFCNVHNARNIELNKCRTDGLLNSGDTYFSPEYWKGKNNGTVAMVQNLNDNITNEQSEQNQEIIKIENFQNVQKINWNSVDPNSIFKSAFSPCAINNNPQRVDNSEIEVKYAGNEEVKDKLPESNNKGGGVRI